MKNLQKTLGFLFLVFAITNLYAQEPPYPEDCIGYWPFNGDVKDKSDFNNDGTPYEVQLSSDMCGNVSSAYEFQNPNSHIKFPVIIPKDSRDFTIAVWVFHIEGSYLFGQYALTSNFTDANHTVTFSGNKYISVDEFRPSQGNLLSNTIMPTNQWTHLVVTRKENTRKIYINGQIDAIQYNAEQYSGLEPSNLILGVRYYNGAIFQPDNTFKGKIDDLIIYDRELMDNEIMTIYSGSNTCCESWLCSENKLTYNTGQNGQVLINTNDLDPSFHLGVKGKIKTEEVLVTLADWPDHVFSDDYKLKPLNQLENYITVNKHLPNIPSENEVIEEGVSLGEMNAKLLEKIEELTLYLIEQNKRLENLENDNLELKKEIIQLKSTE